MNWILRTIFIQYYLHVLCSAQNSRIVSTVVGKIVGQLSRGLSPGGSLVYEYLGVPYALPPVGANRFQPPIASTYQDGIINLQRHGRPCYQDPDTLETFLLNSKTSDDSFPIPSASSEDCLYLNIYAPTPSNLLLPVMIFIHGGDFNFGTGNAYKGTEMVRLYDVIVVTFNYRLGAFGFAFDPKSNLSGNYGLLDQQMVLKWVNSNIQEFGGDPNRVTLFGEEAGASSVHLHLLKGEQLFQNVIIQSATYNDGLWTYNKSSDVYNKFIQNLESSLDRTNISSDLRDESIISSVEILAAYPDNWHPTMYTSFVNATPIDFLKDGIYRKGVNVLTGCNNAAGKSTNIDLVGDDWLDTLTIEVLEKTFTQKYGISRDKDIVTKMSKNYLQFYSWFGVSDVSFVGKSQETFSTVLFSDQLYRTWSQELAEGMVNECNCSVYEYLFAKTTDADLTSFKGADLSEELKYIFGYETSDGLLVKRMMNFWTSFAKTGNPNYETSIGEWPMYDNQLSNTTTCRNSIKIESNGQIKLLNDEVVSRNWPFWEIFYDTLGFSCDKENSTIANDEDDSDPEEKCEDTVGEILGLEMTNETAAILMITFIATTGAFVLACLIILFCFCRLKRKVKKSIKKKKKERKERKGQDNGSFDYKL